MRILVTGGAGFIGSHLVDALIKEGHSVRVFDNLEPQVHRGRKLPSYLNPQAEFVRGDVRSKAAFARVLEDVDVVHHVAAAVGTGQSMHQIKRYTDVNIGGVANLMEVLAHTDHSVKKIVLTGSVAAYGEGDYQCGNCGIVRPSLRSEEQIRLGQWEPLCPHCGNETESLPIKESAPFACQSVYGISKRVQEEMLLVLGKAYGIPTTVLRLFNIYGPRQSLTNPHTAVFAVFSARIREGKPPLVIEDGQQTRDFVYVSDVVRAAVIAGRPGTADFEVLNIGSGSGTSILAVAQGMIAAYGLEEQLEPEVNFVFRKGDVRHCAADISKVRTWLGWEPQVSLKEGLRAVAAWTACQPDFTDSFEKTLGEMADQGLTVSGPAARG